MDIPPRRSHKILESPLFIFSLCGVCGILPDLDHAMAVQLCLDPQRAARFIHFPIFVVVGCIVCCLCALLGRLCIKLVLRRRDARSKL